MAKRKRQEMRKQLTDTMVKALKPRAKMFSVADAEVVGLSVRVMPSGVKTYVVRGRLESRGRITVTLGSDAMPVKQARDMARIKLAEVHKGKDPNEAKRESRKRAKNLTTLRQFLDEDYGPWLLANRKSGQGTLTRLESAFEDLLSTKLRDLTLYTLEKWQTARKNSGDVVEATVNRDLFELRAALYKALRWGFIEKHPMKGIKYDAEDGRIRYLEADEEKRLLDALDAREEDARAERDRINKLRRDKGEDELPDLRAIHYVDHIKPMTLLSLHSGIRRGEMFSMLWSDINFLRRTLTVRAEVAKSKKARHIPLNSTAFEALSTWREQTNGHELVFPGRTGGRFDNIKKAWAALMERAKIVDFHWHDLRHDFASKLVMAGVPLNTVRDLLGHADMKTTLRYAHLAPDAKARAVELLATRKPADNVVSMQAPAESAQ